jgi:IS30 family transposase
MLTVADRVEIAQGLEAGWSIRVIAAHVDRAPSVVSREVRRNWLKTRGYRLVHADCAAQRRRRRPRVGKVAGDEVLRSPVLADLGRSRIGWRSRDGCAWRPRTTAWA